MNNLPALLSPASIAVIGASRDPKSVGHTLLSNLIRGGFAGDIFPVNPHADSILGRTCYPDVASLPATPDMAVIIVPAKIVPTVMTQLGEKGTKAVIIISSGFSEIGEAGREVETLTKQAAGRYGITVLGPNCLGIINPGAHTNASFAMVAPKPGPIAFISQSGAICASMIDYANTMEVGFSKFISIGNKMDVNECDLIDYLADDPDTRVIALYAEQLTDAARFVKTCRRLAASDHPKPVIVLKAGTTDAGATAARSHTGALSGRAATYASLFVQANVTQVDGVEDLLTTAACYAYNRLPSGRRVAIVTNAGGPGILATDTAVRYGLTLGSYSDATKAALSGTVGAIGHAGNPMDVLGDADASRYTKAMDAIAADDGIDSMVVILTPQSTTEIPETADAIIKLRSRCDKPMAVSFMGSATVENAVRSLRDNNVPVFSYPEDGVRTIAHLSAFAERRLRPDTPAQHDVVPADLHWPINRKLAARQPLLADEAAQLVTRYGIATPWSFRWKEGTGIDFGGTAARSFALKILSAQIMHKTDVGGVALNVPREAVIDRARAMIANVSAAVPGASIDGVQVTEMADTDGAAELILGFVREPGLGPMLMIGAGGVMVELLSDVQFRFLPVTPDDIREAIGSLKIAKLLGGFRGGKPYDTDAVIAAAVKLGDMSLAHPEIAECDINPLVVYPVGSGKQPLALDVRIKLQPA